VKLRLALFVAAAAALCSVGTEAAEIAPPPSLKCQPFDVLYFSETKPVVMRLRIMTDGVPLEQAWEGFADALFAKLDTHKSGSLNEKELAKLRPILTLLTGRYMPPNGDVAHAPMTREGLAAYLQLNDLGPLRLPPIVSNQRVNRGGFRRGGAPTAETLDKALMDFLDTNKDGKLSPAELAAGATILSKLDADENEMISMDELLGRPVNSPFFVEDYDGRMAMAGPRADLQSFGRKPDPSLAKRLLGRYGPKPTTNPNTPAPNGLQPVPVEPGRPGGPAGPVESTARRLAPKDVKLSTEQFAALDQDGDGELDAEELARFGRSAIPDVEITLRLGTLPAGRIPAEVLSGGTSLKTIVGDRGTDVALETPGVRLELIPRGTSAEATRTAFRSRYLDRFRALDRDGNGYLDSTETNNDLMFRDLFAFLDTDGDGKVFEKELVAALDELGGLAADAARGMAAVDVAEAGRGLFGLIDTDGDGRLSVRELRAMPKLIARFDADKDGFLSPGEIPRRFRATLSRGLANAVSSPQPVAFNPGGMTATPRPPVGPLWFQKMDRNRDGDVSRREFLGTDEEFRKLDTDGDGLISPQEAEAVGKN
jgi:Ca2+-binding EF-hand superfamily protein